jgi:hypothetical protein
MDLYLKWHKPIPLKDSPSANRIYDVTLDSIPDTPGIYIFFRLHGVKHEALYVGKATSLKTRIRQHLNINNDKLMEGIKNSPNGSRSLAFGEFVAKPGQQLKRSLGRMERGLIRHYYALGDRLLNIQGIRIVEDSLTSQRSELKSLIPRALYFER